MYVYKIQRKDGLYAYPLSYGEVKWTEEGKSFSKAGMKAHLRSRNKHGEYNGCTIVEFILMKMTKVPVEIF